MSTPKKYGNDKRVTIYLSINELNFLFRWFSEVYTDNETACIKKLIKRYKKLKKEKKAKEKNK